jgi:hypothetical protein
MAAWGVDFTWMGDAPLMARIAPWLAACLVIYAVVPLLHVMVEKLRKSAVSSVVSDSLCLLVLLPPLFFSFGLGTLMNSQGAMNHTTQIVTLTLLAQVLAFIWALIRRLPARLPRGYNSQQLAADWARQIIACSYVTSAITKLIESRGNWLKDTPYFGLQVAKATGQAYYDWLSPPNNAAWLADFFINHPHVSQFVLGVALPLELFAFLGLFNRRAGAFFGLSLFMFHSSVSMIMHLTFTYHKVLLIGLFVNPLWWLMSGGRALLPKR